MVLYTVLRDSSVYWWYTRNTRKILPNLRRKKGCIYLLLKKFSMLVRKKPFILFFYSNLQSTELASHRKIDTYNKLCDVGGEKSKVQQFLSFFHICYSCRLRVGDRREPFLYATILFCRSYLCKLWKPSQKKAISFSLCWASKYVSASQGNRHI